MSTEIAEEIARAKERCLMDFMSFNFKDSCAFAERLDPLEVPYDWMAWALAHGILFEVCGMNENPFPTHLLLGDQVFWLAED